jgi:hypothetical protein
MKKVIKIFGLPKTGTTVLNYLININFTNYSCQTAEFGLELYGWKHGLPKSIEEYKRIENITEEKLLFIFTKRDYKSWIDSINKDHIGSWEFPFYFYKKEKLNEGIIFNTPEGPKLYKDFQELHRSRMEKYISFNLKNINNSIIVDFEDIKNNKIKLLENIKNKFNLVQAENSWVTLDKKHFHKSNIFLEI